VAFWEFTVGDLIGTALAAVGFAGGIRPALPVVKRIELPT
jgi:hypothetical protein